MIKRIVLFAVLLLSVGAYSQESKIAYLRYGDVYSVMPETAAAESELAKFTQQVQNELTTMQQEYQRKAAELVQQSDSLSESIKIRRQQDIMDLEERTQTFYQQAQQDVAKKRDDLNAPILQKIETAIKAVGQDHNYTYILESRNFLYISPSATDVTDLVKAKLGIK